MNTESSLIPGPGHLLHFSSLGIVVATKENIWVEGSKVPYSIWRTWTIGDLIALCELEKVNWELQLTEEGWKQWLDEHKTPLLGELKMHAARGY